MTLPVLFTYYLKNVFKFPKEIKNDIIYCQRALKTHITVHQRLVEYFQQKENMDFATKKRILDDIETAIYEINGEQHFLFLRLRRVVYEFLRILSHNNVDGEINAINLLITKEIVPAINNKSVIIAPTAVSERASEQELYEKYASLANEKNVFEVFDSEEEELMTVNPAKKMLDSNMKHIYGNVQNGGNSLSQLSLLKPIGQRISNNIKTEKAHMLPIADASQFLQIDMVEEKSSPSYIDNYNNNSLPNIKRPSLKAPEPAKDPIQLPVSKNVKLSRLNLRQVLKNVRSGNMVKGPTQSSAVLDEPIISPPQSTASSTQQKSQGTTSPSAAQSKKVESKTKNTRACAPATVTAVKPTDLSSSSDDSNQERDLMFPREDEDNRTLPEHYDQEVFLRLFNLFTPDIMVQLQQRRSKRKRRCVHSNERADFHYGTNKLQNAEEQKKKRKAFLLSPQVKRGLQAKRPKRASSDKNEDVELRSSSSSPDDKRVCNECLKGGSVLEVCTSCKGCYHQSCHFKKENGDSLKENSDVVLPDNKSCPACKRAHNVEKEKETEQYQSLHNVAQQLEFKLMEQTKRQENLQQEGKIFKAQMQNLFNIVKTIKIDGDDEVE